MADQGAAAEIAAGYATEAGALELGAVVIDGVAAPEAHVRIPFATLNRHGLVAGATGTGKTKTLQNLAEQCSAAGVPVLLADIKGDLSGMAREGETSDRVTQRAHETGDDWAPTAYPVQFLSLGRGIGVPVRATITGFGPILLSKVLGLNETQESTLGLIFHWADGQGLALLDTKDLRSVIQYLISDEGKAELKGIGGVSASTAGVILRTLVNLEARGGDEFFGEPEFDPEDLLVVESDGTGRVTLLELADQQADPTLYSTFLMWLLAELFEELPEAGDVEKPKLVFFFDEAHLLFSDASKAFLDRIEQTVKLIRSKGVGVFFCTQQPTDVPNDVLSQLGARVQHALRAFTPDDQKALTKTARTYPKSAVYDIEELLTTLGTGEALVTVLSERGAPTPVAWTRIRAPRSLMAAIGEPAVTEAAQGSPLWPKYGTPIDRESAHEKLAARTGATTAPATPPAEPVPPQQAPQEAPPQAPPPAEDEGPGMVEKAMANPAVKSFVRSLASQLGREITRGLFGTARRRR